MQWFKFDINCLDSETFNKYLELSTAGRRSFILSLKNEKDRKLTVAGEMLAKKAVSELYGIDIADIVMEKSPNGRPIIQNCDINISISHSGNFAVCAVDNKPIGIDIEKIREVNLKTAGRFCNKNELEYIFLSQNADEITLRFFKIWTAKEAEFKRLCGTVTDFKQIDTLSINKSYCEIPGYLICISST